MGNANSEILNRSIEEDMGRLYWPSAPYEGYLKLRFCCASCKNETVILDPYPKTWKDIAYLKGDCFTCHGNRKILAVFLEAKKEREPIYMFNGNLSELAKYLRRLLRCESTQKTPDALHFERTCWPRNIKTNNKIVSHNFIWDDEIYKKDFATKRAAFLNYTKSRLRTEGSWQIQVIRSELITTACKQFLYASPEEIRKELNVKFVGEGGVDLGGVTREFFHELSTKFLDPSVGFFVATGPNSTLHPSPASYANEDYQLYFKFFGRFVGKALMEGELINANFTRAIFKLILGKPVTFQDFQTVDRDLFKQLHMVLEYDAETLNSLCLDFTANIFDFGSNSVYELIPHGKEKTVTHENVHEYVRLYTAWRMVDSILPQILSFLEGIFDIVPVQLLSIFNECELELMLNGTREFDVQEWRRYTMMLNFPPNHPIQEWFWEVVAEFDQVQRAMLFHFATGTSRLLGFHFLFPSFNIFCLTEPAHQNLLPFGHTCFNRLDLPLYPSKETLKKKLLTAISFGSIGFALD